MATNQEVLVEKIRTLKYTMKRRKVKFLDSEFSPF